MSTESVSVWKSMLAGSLAGSMSTLVCHPLDLIRTKIQIEKTSNAAKSQMRIVLSSVREVMLANKGVNVVFAFYRGLFPPLAAQIVYKAIVFGSNNVFQKYIIPNVSMLNSSSSNVKTFVSGTYAGCVVAFAVSPVEYIRTKQILTSYTVLPGRQGLISTLLSIKNPLILWTSFLPTMLRDGPGVGFYFLVYDMMKSNYMTRNRNADIPLSYRVLAGSFAGISFWAWAMPFDTIKTTLEAEMIRNNNKNAFSNSIQLFLSTTKNVWENGGIKRFYRGWPVAMIRGIPSAAVTLSVYDMAIQYRFSIFQ